MLMLCIWSSNLRASQGWTLYIDNDKFGPRGTDRDYTGSFALSYASPADKDLPLPVEEPLSLIDTRKHDPGSLLMHGFEFGLVAFTPANITIETPQPGDRPYASLMYITSKRHRMYVHDNISIAHSLTVGAFGLAAASDLQQEIHEIVKSDQPRGWSNQISDGGEPTLRYLWEYRRLGGDYTLAAHRRLQWGTAAGFSLGYLTEGIFGLNLRFGHLTDPWWSHHSSPTGFGDRLLTVPGQYANGGGPYVWASINTSWRLYNAFLQGQFRDSAVTYDSDELRDLTARLSVGAGWAFSNRWRLSYYLQTQTSEVRTGLADRTFTWGGIVLEVPTD
ncbi:MAG TPA: lipid A deacylase LpxR family protein [Gammaproteobacteria bacterium]